MEPLDFLKSEDVRQYLDDLRDQDPTQVVLNPPAKWKEHAGQLADQLISRKKAKDKLPMWVLNKQVIWPPPLSIEQSSSEDAANYKASLVSGVQLVDLTGGMGVDCLQMSNGFENTTYVEQNEWLCSLFKHNQKLLAPQPIHIVNQDAEEFLKAYQGKAIFFIDPARRDTTKNKVFQFEDCNPRIADLLPLFQTKALKVLIKASPLIDISHGIRELERVCEIHVLSIKNECKEVLFLLNFEKTSPDNPIIHCINLQGSELQKFEFSLPEEKTHEVTYGNVSQYLYDPNSSILKAGAFKSVARDFPVQKIATNTHLYTSEQYLPDFPGRRFRVIANSLTKSDLKGLVKANIISKNHPQKPEEIKKQYGIKDGGNYFLIGFRDQKNKPCFCLTSSI